MKENQKITVTLKEGKSIKDICSTKKTSNTQLVEEQLRVSEEKYRNLITKMMNAFALHEIIFDEKGELFDYKFLEVNPAWEKTIGIKSVDVIGKTIREVFPEIGNLWTEKYAEVVKTGVPEEFEYYATVTQKYFYCYVYIPEQGKIAIIFNDTTEQRQEEERVKESEKRFRSVFDQAAVGVARVNIDGSWLEVNAKFCNIIGYTNEELLKKTFKDITHPDDLQTDIDYINQLLNNEIKTYTINKRYLKKGGGVVWVKLTESLVRKINNDPDYFIGVVEDITSQKNDQDTLIENEKKYRSIFDQAAVGVARVNLDGSWVEVNAKFCDIIGYSNDELLTKRLSDITHPDDLQADLDYLNQLLNDDIKTFSMSKRYLKKNGDIAWVNLTGSLARKTNNEPDYFIGIVKDITSQKKDQDDLHESEKKFRAVFEQAGGYNMILDPNTSDGIPIIVDANKAACEIHGYSREEFIGRPVSDVDDEAGKLLVKKRTAEIMTGEPFFVENIHVCKDGTSFPVSVNAKRVDIGEKTSFIFTTEYDISEQKEAEALLQKANSLLMKLSDTIPAAIYQYRLYPDGSFSFPYASVGIEDLYEVSAENVMNNAQAVFDVIHPDDSSMLIDSISKSAETMTLWDIEYRVQLPKKGLRWLQGHSKPERLKDGSILWHGFMEDITDRKTIEFELKEQKNILDHQAHHDALTGLPNRVLFNDRLKKAIQTAKRKKTKMALLFIDLDHFKEINDSLGHDVGDEILKAVSRRLKEVVRDEDTIARLGGDEFTVTLEELSQTQAASLIANKLLEVLSKPMNVNGNILYVSSSIGISIYPDDGGSTQNLLKYADSAMYKAKAEGRNNFQYYNSTMTELAFERVVMETSLRVALKEEQFVVHYQPQVNAKTDTLIGMEALVRWQHPTMGIVSPAKFIPLAESTGLIVELDRFVMKTAMNQIAKWYKDGLNPGVLALNLAVKQLQEKDFIDILHKLIKETKCKAEWIGLEVTESQIMTNPDEAIKLLTQISDLGIELAVDDFGTGYSSLAYLTRLPIDKLKIDQAFIRNLPENEEDSTIARAVIALAKSLNLRVIAEGVETQEQKDFIVENGCETIQGYFYSKAISAEKMETLLSI